MSDWGDVQDAYRAECLDDHVRLRKRTADLERQLAEARVALEHIVRECSAINKGPVAVAIARAALSLNRGP